MAEDMEQAGNAGNWPKWDMVGPDEHGTVVIHWQGAASDNVQQLPLGTFDAVGAKLADWLAQNDFGE